jgi:hypothetical protein
VYTHI